ncbi:glycine zipper 2TM domain-containing protein [Sulfuriferula sp.]|uniref:glycine zipper 2TM domain-containing protein n=1 Tax=Sulfuriferula sp. TaxID=2025307 RepID=UPI00272FCF71|nr:glycine zipper 2TM domain-containing protein [Sulfuriferula sp.]MDP2026399.1 glycine zipper 2TM domain-containing protein [Sulfuriferula sp.]
MMSMLAKLKWVLGLLAVLGLAGCESMGTRSNPTYSGSGVVQSIEFVKGGIAGSGLGLGTVVGGVVGGILGSQVGSGTGQTVATVGGAAAGAYVGHQLEKGKTGTGDGYKFTIRMDDGSYQTVTQATTGNFRVGDKVRIENGALYR